MDGQPVLPYRSRRTPRAVGADGVVFAVLLGASPVLRRTALDHDPSTAIDWAGARVRLPLTLMPFAGIAFLWFISMVRERLGAGEDRRCSAVGLREAVVFVAMVFGSMAMVYLLSLGAVWLRTRLRPRWLVAATDLLAVRGRCSSTDRGLRRSPPFEGAMP